MVSGKEKHKILAIH